MGAPPPSPTNPDCRLFIPSPLLFLYPHWSFSTPTGRTFRHRPSATALPIIFSLPLPIYACRRYRTAAMANDTHPTVRRRRATTADAPGGGHVAATTTAAAASVSVAVTAPDPPPGLVPVLRPQGLQLSPVQGLQVVLQDKDNVSVLSQFIFFSIAVAALPVAVFFLVRRGLSPAAVVTDGGPPPPPSALVTALVSAAPRLLTASRVPSLVAALAAVLAVNVVTGAFVLRALIEDARLVAAVGGAPPAAEVAAAVAEAAAAGVTREGGGGGGSASETGAAVARPAAPPSAVTTNATSAAADMPP